jgi:hypothetical protein
VFDSAGRHPYTSAQDSNTLLKNVTREVSLNLFKQHAAFSRVLSFLLLGFIVYGTTVEAAHTHGNLAGVNKAVAAASFSDPATETKLNGNLAGCGDCLICQLHRHFSATVISVPPIIIPSSLRSHFFNLTAVSVHSETNAPRRGRAPPFTL